MQRDRIMLTWNEGPQVIQPIHREMRCQGPGARRAFLPSDGSRNHDLVLPRRFPSTADNQVYTISGLWRGSVVQPRRQVGCKYGAKPGAATADGSGAEEVFCSTGLRYRPRQHIGRSKVLGISMAPEMLIPLLGRSRPTRLGGPSLLDFQAASKANSQRCPDSGDHDLIDSGCAINASGCRDADSVTCPV